MIADRPKLMAMMFAEYFIWGIWWVPFGVEMLDARPGHLDDLEPRAQRHWQPRHVIGGGDPVDVAEVDRRQQALVEIPSCRRPLDHGEEGGERIAIARAAARLVDFFPTDDGIGRHRPVDGNCRQAGLRVGPAAGGALEGAVVADTGKIEHGVASPGGKSGSRSGV